MMCKHEQRTNVRPYMLTDEIGTCDDCGKVVAKFWTPPDANHPAWHWSDWMGKA